jgi:hypothetical protein
MTYLLTRRRMNLLKNIADTEYNMKPNKKHPPKMLPFDLEKALAGHPVCTREGSRVLEINKFDSPMPFPVIVFIEGRKYVDQFTIEGTFFTKSECPHDLFLLAPEPEKIEEELVINDFYHIVGQYKLMNKMTPGKRYKATLEEIVE